jgi:hypothetical protein
MKDTGCFSDVSITGIANKYHSNDIHDVIIIKFQHFLVQFCIVTSELLRLYSANMHFM